MGGVDSASVVVPDEWRKVGGSGVVRVVRCEVVGGSQKEARCGRGLLVGVDFCIGQTAVIVDCGMDEVESDRWLVDPRLVIRREIVRGATPMTAASRSGPGREC